MGIKFGEKIYPLQGRILDSQSTPVSIKKNLHSEKIIDLIKINKRGILFFIWCIWHHIMVKRAQKVQFQIKMENIYNVDFSFEILRTFLGLSLSKLKLFTG